MLHLQWCPIDNTINLVSVTASSTNTTDVNKLLPILVLLILTL